MFRMLIKPNYEKIKSDKTLSADGFDEVLRDICLSSGFREKTPGEYYLDEGEDEMGRMIVLKAKFDKIGYVVPNLTKWITYRDDEGETNELEFW